MSITLIIIFSVATIGIICFSWWLSIKEHRYHGIARFFAFESILILFLLNYKHWFENPFSIHQIISWILLVISLFPALYGFYLLHKIGKPKDINFENTTKLVVQGIYKYIRHPLYCSLLLLGLGIFFKKPSIIGVGFALINIIALIITAKVEEKEMIAKFGSEYAEYMKKTKMFVPFVI